MKATNALLESLLPTANTVRADGLKCGYEWTFSGDSSLSSWKNPPPTQFVLTHLLYGHYAENVGGKRDTEVTNVNSWLKTVIQLIYGLSAV